MLESYSYKSNCSNGGSWRRRKPPRREPCARLLARPTTRFKVLVVVVLLSHPGSGRLSAEKGSECCDRIDFSNLAAGLRHVPEPDIARGRASTRAENHFPCTIICIAIIIMAMYIQKSTFAEVRGVQLVDVCSTVRDFWGFQDDFCKCF